MRFRLLIGVTFVVTLLAVAGCGGGKPKDATVGLDAATILTQSRETAATVTAFRLAATARLAAKITGGDVPKVLTGLLTEPITIDGEGPVNDDAVSFDFDASFSGLPPLQANVTKVGGELFLALLGVDYRVDLPAESVAAIRPASLPAGLLSWATAPKEVGREDVDGSPTVHLAATLDAGAVTGDVGGVLGTVRGAPISPADLRRAEPALRKALGTRTLDLWISTEDLTLRRAVAKIRFSGPVEALPGVRTASLDLDARFSDIGKQVEITAPDAKQTLDLDALSRLGG